MRRLSRSRSALALACALALLLAPARARAQACCAGTGALTPGRLAMHEDALVGAQLRAASVIGSWDDAALYARSPPGATELDFEESLFGAVRVVSHGQVALLVPFPETYRKAGGRSETGGGVGDVNGSVRYDFYLAGQSRTVPGVALLAGVTAPTGTPPDKATKPLATDATGVGTWQFNGGVALEQLYGSVLVNLTGIVAKRLTRTVQGQTATLGTRFTALAGAAYTFDNGMALSASASFAGETRVSQRILELSLGGMIPVTDHWRVQGSVFVEPPFDQLGRNEPALAGFGATIVRSWW